jgi:hypothetical protein
MPLLPAGGRFGMLMTMAKPHAKLVALLRPKRRWAQFSLGTMFIAVAVICVGLAIKVHRANKQREAAAAVTASGGWVEYDFQFVQGKFDPNATSRLPAWLKPRLADVFHHVVQVNLVYDDATLPRRDNRNESDQVLRHLDGFPRLKRLLLHGGQASDEGMAFVGKLRELEELYMWDATNLSDKGIARLADLTRLKSIHVSNSRITDESLDVFGRMRQLEQLSLQGNHFTDRGLEHLAGLSHLEDLWIGIGDCQVTDAGLVHLEGLSMLTTLELQESKVTDQGVRRLQNKLPKLKRIVR